MTVEESFEGVNVSARLAGPPVAACFNCDNTVPIPFIHWYGELSKKGRFVALLPYCDRCLVRRERKQALVQLLRAEDA
jgi:hypothetical protein